MGLLEWLDSCLLKQICNSWAMGCNMILQTFERSVLPLVNGVGGLMADQDLLLVLLPEGSSGMGLSGGGIVKHSKEW